MVFYEGALSTGGYCNVLAEGLLTTAEILHPDGYQFVQDNAPCHAAAATTAWLKDHGVRVLPWPSVSPDLNPIENLWSMLKSRVEKRIPKTKEELKRSIEEGWSMIDLTTLKNLATSMANRLRQCM